MPLTVAAIRNAKPREKAYKLFDGRGMYLEVSPRGGKWWRLKYRLDGKERRISLGVFPDVTLAGARTRRDEARALIDVGIDPSTKKAAEKARVTAGFARRSNADPAPKVGSLSRLGEQTATTTGRTLGGLAGCLTRHSSAIARPPCWQFHEEVGGNRRHAPMRSNQRRSTLPEGLRSPITAAQKGLPRPLRAGNDVNLGGRRAP